MNSPLEAIKNAFKKNNLDACLIRHAANVSYLAGFGAKEAFLFITKKENFFITDFRYLEESKCKLKNKNFSIACINDTFSNFVNDFVKLHNLKRVGFEAKWTNVFEYDNLCRTSPNIFFPTVDLIEKLREKKTKTEIENIKTAVKKTLLLFNEIKKILKPQLSEIEASGEIEKLIRHISGKPPAFEPIITSGSRSSQPHATATKEKIKKNSSVLVDIGIDVNGYKSDLTRMFFLGKIPSKIKEILEIIRASQKKAFSVITCGVKASYVDKTARGPIEDAGYGDFFGHSLGHGIGLEVHENPSISPRNDRLLEEGMVFTVEPAIYLPEEFGVRLEDIVLVTKTKCEVLSASFAQ